MRKLSIFLSCLLFAGCTTVGGPIRDVTDGVGITQPVDGRTTGADTIIADFQLKYVDLVELLDPEKRRYELCLPNLRKFDEANESVSSRIPSSRPGQDKKRDEYYQSIRERIISYRSKRKIDPIGNVRDSFLNADLQKYSEQDQFAAIDVQCAFNAFYTYTKNEIGKGEGFSADMAETALIDPSLIIRRNSIQDQIMAVSEKSCTQFKISINDRITKANFAFGSIATTLAGLGAIFTDPATARGLSGASAIISGINAEYNESYLQSLTVKVITAGIDSKRAEIRDDINGRRYGNASTADRNKFTLRENEKPFYLASRPYLALSPYDKSDEELLRNSDLISEIEANLSDNSTKISSVDRFIAQIDAEIATGNSDPRLVRDKQIAQSDKKRYQDERSRLEATLQREQTRNTVGKELQKVSAVGHVPLSQYTVELAIHDAIQYHAACTIPAGLEKAADSVEEIRNPGTATLQRAVDTMNVLQDKLNQNSKLRSRGETDRLEEQIKYLDAQKRLEEKIKERSGG